MKPQASPGEAIRQAGPAALARALTDSRSDTLATFALYEAALAERGMAVPYATELNPPLWELGHIGWFHEWWIGRNSERHKGWVADPQAPRTPPQRGDADALYNSGLVPHASRWQLALPDADRTRAELAAEHAQTLALLRDATADDGGLYFHRLALLHEDMHHEAAVYMAQNLGLGVSDARWQPAPLPGAMAQIGFDASPWRLGHADPGFAFDNELGAHDLQVGACQIDARVVRWAEYLPFIEAGGYDDACCWSAAGRAWLATQPQRLPRYVRRAGRAWQQQRWGTWQALDPAGPACHLTLYEAQAWCAWAGRRLPTEAEWERAALQRTGEFEWGAVWEWTASPFLPYPGFCAHPYRDYSAPWFGSRQVLRGASFATQPRMRHARYRNYFTPERNDIFAGFRSCAS
jgi:ergothioneine biosynthesis protein EgtB